MADIEQKKYHYDQAELMERVRESLKHHKPYQKLYEQYQRLDPRRDFVKCNLIQTKMRKIEEDEVHRLVQLEDKRQQDVNAIDAMLRELNPDDHRRYQQLMACLSMGVDMLDHTFASINGLLYANGIGVKMFQFPEVSAAKKMLSELADMEVDHMPKYKANVYIEESDRLWDHLQERCAVYIRKIDRIEAKLERIEKA